MFFYEIHEGDDEVGTAVLVGHEQRFEPEEFFALVKKIRAQLLENYEEDTLSEAIANELQRSHGCIHVTDDLLVASVNVDETDENTFLVTDSADARRIFVQREDNGHAGHDHGDPQDNEPVSERIGFVGTGIMGAPMARNARKVGFDVSATNRTLARAEALAKDGITIAKTPRDVAKRSDIVVTMVVDSPDVEAVLFGPDGVAA